MKRFLFKVLTLALLVFFVGNYLIYLKTGQVPLHALRERMGHDWLVDLRELFAPEQLARDAKNTIQTLADQVSEPEPVAPTKIYKWTDAKGQVHFGDKPQAQNAQQLEVSPRNAISAPVNAAPPANPSARQDASQNSAAPESPLDKARAAAEAMRQQVEQQEQAGSW